MLDPTISAALHHHTIRASATYPPFASPREVLDRLRDRLTKLEAAIGSDNDPKQRSDIPRRMLETAVIALRGIHDLNLPLPPLEQLPCPTP